MNHYTIEYIQPLIADIQETGRSVQVVFQCPVSGTQVSSRATATRTSSAGNQFKRSTERSLMYAVQRMVGQVVRDVFGHGTLGRVASDITRQTVSSASSKVMNGLSKQEKEDAILEAFKRVERQFSWNEEKGLWISSSAVAEIFSEFEQQKQHHPIVHPYDVQILSRMMVEISMADGHLIQSEREWLMLLLNPEYGTLEQIAQFPPLTTPELSSCSTGGVRVTMIMIAAAVSMCDEHLADQELQLLQTMANGLGLSTTERQNAKKWAQSYILEQAIEYINLSAHGNLATARSQILALASKIGLSEHDALTIEAKVKRRQSNF